MRQKSRAVAIVSVAVGVVVWAVGAQAGPPKDPPANCAPDAVLAGSLCVDTYEASVWLVPATNLAGKSNKGLIQAIEKGKAGLADLTAGNATQRGCAFAPYSHAAYPATFPSNGNWVPDIAQPLPPSPGVYACRLAECCRRRVRAGFRPSKPAAYRACGC